MLFYLMHISLYIVHFAYTSSNELYLLLFNMYTKSFERELRFYGFHSFMKITKVLTGYFPRGKFSLGQILHFTNRLTAQQIYSGVLYKVQLRVTVVALEEFGTSYLLSVPLFASTLEHRYTW